MGGVEYAVPVGVIILLYFLFPAYLKNRQERLIERMRDEYKQVVHRAGGARLAGKYVTFPAAIAVTSDYLIVHNVMSLFPDEVPLERLRNISLQYKMTKSVPHPEDDTESGNVLIITTTEQIYRLLFEDPEDAAEWKNAIQRAL